ncbi:MAG TPA: cation:proton antiporter [Aliidongia sp.]|uniref:cation:proton antiporter domain-containing protein n=1 Tax=Aliidongia sp. TaxID=1914230 RepID=UPI002DDD76D0|nr:cation:proton antiporter [Aliidongia sp.]HEV2673016.1 cation:proton antiporter [Aliidongia sp.]
MTENPVISALEPVILLLALGVGAAVLSRASRLSPIVGYLVLGIALKAAGITVLSGSGTVRLLAELGVVFLLFDIGLHFSLHHVRQQAGDIFGFGPVQILFGTLMIGLLALAFGLAPLPAFLLGAILALSSTAVVAPLIAERHQQNCPVGLTATAILVFQDVAAIFLLIVTGALGGEAILPIAALALAKAVGAFAVAVLFARIIVRPLFNLIARGRQEEVFTATALLIALSAGWATGQIGLSLTLGAFLGGMTIAETPYRAIVESEVKPFRGLLLGFFFISVGLSLDLATLLQHWLAVIVVTFVLIAAKILSNAAASLVFRWSIPGSLQLGFLLAQGSEFAFVVLSLPTVRDLIGSARISIVAAAVALSLAVTPTLAISGRTLAGRLRLRAAVVEDPELKMAELAAPVLIIGMGRVGRTVADALRAFDIGYSAVERDQRRLNEAVADGYAVVFGDMADPRLWDPIALQGRRISALTAPRLDVSSDLTPIAQHYYPGVLRFAAVADHGEAECFHKLGVRTVMNREIVPGLDLAAAILGELGIDSAALADWVRRQRERASRGTGGVTAPSSERHP